MILLDCIVTAVVPVWLKNQNKTSKLVNFCVAILILMMEENRRHSLLSVLYYFKKGKNATEMQKKICTVCGENAVADRTCQKWFLKFRARDVSLDHAPRCVDQLKLIAIKLRH